MIRNRDGAALRRMRLNEIIDYIAGNSELSEKLLKTRIAVKTGLTLSRVEVYIEELEQAGIIVSENDRITLATKHEGATP